MKVNIPLGKCEILLSKQALNKIIIEPLNEMKKASVCFGKLEPGPLPGGQIQDWEKELQADLPLGKYKQNRTDII